MQDRQYIISQRYGSDARFDSSLRMIMKHEVPGRKQECAMYSIFREEDSPANPHFIQIMHNRNLKMGCVYGNRSAYHSEKLLV